MVRRLHRCVERDLHDVSRRAAKRAARQSAPASSEKAPTVRAKPASPKRRRSAGSADQGRQRFREGVDRTRLDEESGDVVHYQFGNPRDARRHARQFLALGFEQDIGQAVAVAVRTQPAWQREYIRGAIGVEYGGMRLRTLPLDASGNAETACRVLELPQHRPAAYMREPPMPIGRESRQRRQQIVEPFLVDGAPNGEDPDGTLRVGPVVAAMRFARRRKPSRIDPVVIEVHGSARARELAQMPRIDVGAGRDPRAGIELLAFLPFGCRPDVLGMRRAAPGKAAQEGGVPGHRGWRVQEMRVQVDDGGRQLRRQHESLSQAANPASRRIAPEIAPPCGDRCAVSGKSARVAPAAQHAGRFVVQIFGEVSDRRADLGVNRMDLAVGRMPKRK